jgi:hypothetical protein
MNPHLLLTFGNALNQNRILRINHADPDITDNEVSIAMNEMVLSNTITGAGGLINSLRRAVLVETTVTPIPIS